MKTTSTKETIGPAKAGSGFKNVCLASCQKVVAQIRETRATLLAESRDTLKVQEQLLRLAFNEAEALASQTLYPHLMFPALAAEKIQGVVAWNARQRRLGSRARSFSVTN